MKTNLTQQQILSYRTNGFLYVPGFLASTEVTELKAAVLKTVAAMGRTVVAGDSETKIGDDYYSNVFTQRMNLWRLDPTVKRYMLNPELGRLLCQLTSEKGMRVWHDQALIKEPFGNPTAWHLDNPYWSFYSRGSISIWVALEDATVENGCMWFLPASQNLAAFEKNIPIGQNLGGLFQHYPQMTETDPVPVPMKAGDCSFHCGMTAHGAGANMTRKRRIAMTCAYMPDSSTFNGQRNILPEAYFKSLKPGDVLANDDWNPLVHRNGT
jgi:hypothetical protein